MVSCKECPYQSECPHPTNEGPFENNYELCHAMSHYVVETLISRLKRLKDEE